MTLRNSNIAKYVSIKPPTLVARAVVYMARCHAADMSPWLSACSPHGAAELLVGHAAVLFLLSPQVSHGLRLEELEDALTAVLPLHQALVLLWVDQDVPDELPQVGSTGC